MKVKFHRALLCVSTGAAALVSSWAGSEPVTSAPTDKVSISQGRKLFLMSCAACHGANGKAEVEAMSNAANLTKPKYFKRGSTDAAIFNSIQNGVGNGMPPQKGDITPEDTWKIVAFIRSIDSSRLQKPASHI